MNKCGYGFLDDVGPGQTFNGRKFVMSIEASEGRPAWGLTQERHADRADPFETRDYRVEEKSDNGGHGENKDKIRCLDGLRGIACLLVFNYHFLWPWEPMIMMGYGAFPPRAPEPYTAWPSLPILCLLHRGRPMVAIFFAISGYVLCRHILRSIHERRLDVAYRRLASSAFRRVFRLYIPPTLSMLLVAVLAQMGVFRSEVDIYKGPDSRYINGTVSVAHVGAHCAKGVVPVIGAAGVADYLGLHSADFLANITGSERPYCLNVTSVMITPTDIYGIAAVTKGLSSNKTIAKTQLKPKNYKLFQHKDVNMTWAQYGGSWEEHPLIHEDLGLAVQNFTRAYAEWANPFNFNHNHPRYDPHTFTIPKELRGSMVIYLYLLATAALKARWRLGLASLLSVYSLVMGHWDMATFLGGTVLSEMHIRSSEDVDGDRTASPGMLLSPATDKRHGRGRRASKSQSSSTKTIWRWALIVLALFFLSFPDAGAEYTPGFQLLSSLIPKYYIPLAGWMFYQAIGAVILVHCVLDSPMLRGLLESRLPQYAGKLSFSFYLVHGPVLHSLGFWIMPRLFDRFGRMQGYLVGYVVLLAVTVYLSRWWYWKVDLLSVKIGKRLEQMMLES